MTQGLFRSHKLDTTPTHRFRFTEAEWKLILEAVSFYADHLAQAKFPDVKHIYDSLITENMAYHRSLGQAWLGVKEGDPQFEQWQKISVEYTTLKKKVQTLNAIERQLMLSFHLIASSLPPWALTRGRIMQ